jgi:hypothetical protein
MNPPSDMKTDPLTPEEQALAQRLARLGPHGEPSPALDARILAAAHDATVPNAGVHGPRRRWPVAFGIAASLALAVGIAWQLRPLPQTTAAYQTEAPVAASAQTISEPAAVTDAPMESATTPADAAAIAQQADAAATTSAPAPKAGRESAKAMKSTAPATPPPVEQPPVEPDIVFDSPTPAANAAARPMNAAAAPQAFGSPPPPAAATASDKHRSAAAAAEAAAALPETDTLDRLQATGTDSAAASDEPDTDVPPATMTSPEARDAWLARIRELVAAGKSDAARASLREFMHRYPDAPLPDDLRALGQ